MSISHIEKEFLNNKYTKWYNNIVSNASKDKRKKNDEIYYERHHIIPKCKPFLGHNKKETLYIDVDLLNEYLQKGYNTGRGNYKRKETR